MSDDERPVHRVVDCSVPAVAFDEEGNLVVGDTTPRFVETPLTDEEWEEHKRIMAEHATQREAEEKEREALAEAAASHPDPLVQALARRAGIFPES